MSGVTYLSPPGLHNNPAFSQVVMVEGVHKTVYVGGQNAVNEHGDVPSGSLAVQADMVARNIVTALAAAGAGLEHVVKWTVYLVEGQNPRAAFEAFQHVWGAPPNPPAITVLQVSGLAHPSFLLEIDAIAVVPTKTIA